MTNIPQNKRSQSMYVSLQWIHTCVCVCMRSVTVSLSVLSLYPSFSRYNRIIMKSVASSKQFMKDVRNLNRDSTKAEDDT